MDEINGGPGSLVADVDCTGEGQSLCQKHGVARRKDRKAEFQVAPVAPPGPAICHTLPIRSCDRIDDEDVSIM